MNYIVKKDAEQLKEDALKMQKIIINLVKGIVDFDLLDNIYLLIIHNEHNEE